MSGLQQLYPFAGNNAIESAVFRLEWAGGRDASLLSEAVTVIPQMQKLGFADAKPVKAMTLSFGGNGFGANAVGIDRRPEDVGYVFQKKNAQGNTLREVSIRDSQLVVIVRDYTRWKNVWKDVSTIFSVFADLLLKHEKQISGVALQYSDKFQWKSAEKFPTEQILIQSPLLCSNAFQARGSWHSQHGYFADPKIEWANKRLDNVNISLASEGDTPTLAILTVHQYSVDADSAIDQKEFHEKTLAALFNAAHDDNKAILSGMLSAEVRAKISLGAAQ